MSRFIEESGIGGSRSGFYRLMSEPKKLSEADIGKIKDILELDNAMMQELLGIISLSALDYTPADQEFAKKNLLESPRYLQGGSLL